MRNLPSAVLAATILALPGAAGAQDGSFTFLGRLILAAGLSPAPEAALPRAVSLVTGDELRERGIDQAVDALRALPGVAVNRSGGPGGLTQVRLRGTEGRHVQVILDGVRLDPAQNGEFDFSGLQTADIERIEVIRGPQSVFFGSNTIGGVISITTRRATEPGFSGHVGIEGGSDGTVGLDFQLGLRGERGGVTVSGIGRNEGGYDISGTPGGQADGMTNRTLNVAGDYQLSDDWRVGFLLRGRNQINQTDPQQYGAGPISDIVFDRDDFTRFQERIASLYAEGDLADGRLRLTLRASRFLRHGQHFDNAAQSSDDTADRTEFALRAIWALDGGTPDTARHTLAFGADRTTEGFVNNDPAYVWDPSQLVRQSRTNTGLSLEYRGTLSEGLDIQAGIRHDLNDRFANFTTWSFGLSQAITASGTRLRASVGTGVQNPTLFNQFGFIPGSFIGNPDLQPEQSLGWDIGFDQTVLGGNGQVSLTYFDNRLTNRIYTTGFPSTPVNATGRSRRSGIELTFDGRITDRLRLRGGYTFTDARGESGERLVRRPRHEIGLGLDWDASDRTLVSIDARGVFDNLDNDFRGFAFDPPAIHRLPDYALVHLAVTHRLNDRLSLHARINNLFDHPYQEVLGYAGQGRTFYVGLRTQF